MFKFKLYKNKYEYILHLMIILLMGLICLRNIHDLNIPFILNDEYGYWASASQFGGYNWNEVIKECMYYSYGYGIILTIIIKFFSNMIIAYKFAIILNYIFLSLSYLILFLISKKILPEINTLFKILICAIVCLYSSNVTQVNYTWPEIFLFFLYSLVTYLVIIIFEKPTYVRCILLSVLSFYTYMIHQRSLGILISVFIIMLLLLFNNKINLRKVICFIIIMVLLFLLHSFIKNYLMDTVWRSDSSNNLLSRNDYSGQASKLIYIFSKEGFMAFLTSICGKLYNIFIGSFGIVLFTLILIFKKFIYMVKNKEYKLTKISFLYIFLFLSFILTLLISSIFMIHPGTTTHLVYGRYTDNILGPFLLVGLLNLCIKKERNQYEILISLIIISIVALGVNYAINYFSLTYRDTTVNNPTISIWFNGTILKTWLSVVCVILVFSILFYFLNLKKRSIILLFMLGIVWIFIGSYSYKVFANVNWKDVYSSIMQIYTTVNEMEKEKNDVSEIYCITTPGYITGNYGNALQFLYKDRIIHYIDYYEFSSYDYSENSIFIAHKTMTNIEGLKIIGDFGEYKLYCSVDNNFINYEFNLDLTKFILGEANINKNNEVISSEKEGFILYGPYMPMKAGNYDIYIDYEVIHQKGDNIGYVDIASNQGTIIYTKQEITGNMSPTNNIKLTVSLDNIEDLEIRFWQNEGNRIKIKKIYYKVLSSNNIVGTNDKDSEHNVLNFINKIKGVDNLYYATANMEIGTYDFSIIKQSSGINNCQYILLNEIYKISDQENFLIIIPKQDIDIFSLIKKYDLIYLNDNYGVFCAIDKIGIASVESAGGYPYSINSKLNIRYFQYFNNGYDLNSNNVKLPFGTYNIISILDTEAKYRTNYVFNMTYAGGEYSSNYKYDYKLEQMVSHNTVSINKDGTIVRMSLTSLNGVSANEDIFIERVDEGFLWYNNSVIEFIRDENDEYYNTNSFISLNQGHYSVELVLEFEQSNQEILNEGKLVLTEGDNIFAEVNLNDFYKDGNDNLIYKFNINVQESISDKAKLSLKSNLSFVPKLLSMKIYKVK